MSPMGHGLLDRRDPASVHSTEHCLVGPFSSHAHKKKPRRPALPPSKKRGIAEAMPKWWSPPAANSLCFVLGRGCVRLCSPIPSRRQAGLGWVWCVCGGAGLWWPKSHPQPTTSLTVREEPQAGAAASKHPQQAEEPSRRCNFTPPRAFGSPSPISSRVRRRTGETPPHTPPHRRHKLAVMVRSAAREILRERSGVRGVEEEPRSPLAVAIGRIVLDVGRRRSKSSSVGGRPPAPSHRVVRVWIVGDGVNRREGASHMVLCVAHREKTRSARGSHSAGRTGP